MPFELPAAVISKWRERAQHCADLAAETEDAKLRSELLGSAAHYASMATLAEQSSPQRARRP